jgi:SUMO ligase MMS21 Smc5/6 complex component
MSAPLVSLRSETDSLNDIKTVAETSFQQCYEMINDILKYSPNGRDDLQTLKMHMNAIANSQKEITGLIHAVNDTCNLTDRVNITEEQVTRQFLNTVNDYIEKSDIDDTQKDVLFSLDSFINNDQASDNHEEDTDLLVTKTTLSYKDPLTKCNIQDPVKSKLCKHSYERDSIMKYLSDKRKNCPYSGCQSKLSKSDLVDDFILKIQIGCPDFT